jgi:hypothetical protein
MSSPDGQLR